MHIVQVNPIGEYYSPVSGGAVASVIMHFTTQLLRRGHQVSVLSGDNGDAFYPIGNVVPMPPAERRKLSFLRRRLSALRYKLSEWDFHFYDIYQAGVTRAIRGLVTTPDVIIVHNDLIAPQYLRRLAPNAIILVWLHNENRTRQSSLKPTVDATDCFVCVSDYIQSWTTQHHPVPADKITTIVNGADVEAFRPRSELKPANGVPRVLFLGRIDPNKGPDLVVDACAALKARGIGTHLTVAGSVWFYNHDDAMADPYFRSLTQKMKHADADYRGHVVRKDVPDLVREHDVVCVLSRSNDPCPLVPLEAMAGGCAVLASSRGGLPQSCGGAAVFCDPDKLDTVIEGLASLVTDTTSLIAHKERCLAHAARNNWGDRADQFEALLARIARRS
jgi:glycosyltransferase involved in cell wall biosynthesis